MAKKTDKNTSIDMNTIDALPFDTGTSAKTKREPKEYDSPANRWLNLDLVVGAGDKEKRVPLPFGIILDSIEERLAEKIEEGLLSKGEITSQQFLIKILDKAFAEMPAGSSKQIKVVARLSKPASSEEAEDVADEDWSL